MSMAAGTRLGHYEILGALGSGAMGDVYRARDPRIGRDVAIKMLPAGFAADPDRLRRFDQEARATGALNHPNVLTIYDTGVIPVAAGGSPYIVAELLEGSTLRAAVDRGPLPASTAIDYAIQIARGLAAAHGKGIVHRDVKPENIFITRDGRLKILDFGIAKLTAADASDGEKTATQLGLVVGTAAYMSPEQARGQPVDHRSDLFSLGSILYEMLSGRRAFHRDSIADTVSAVLRDSPAPLRDLDPAVAPALRRIVDHALEKAPELRFQSAADLAFDLGTLLAQHPQLAPAPHARIGRRAAAALSVAAVLGLSVVGLWYLKARDVVSGPVRSTAPRVAPFLSSSAIQNNPAWSPTGNLIAYESDASGESDIWICDPSGANAINLTSSLAGTADYPTWSSDSQRIAFYSDHDGGGIYTMTALGGGLRREMSIKPGILYAFSLTWSRDGSLVYTNFSEQGLKQVYRLSLASGASTCLTCGMVEGGARAGELSPSGQLLAFKSSEMGTRGTLYVVHLASGRVNRILERVDYPRWSIADDSLFFISSRDGISDLWRIGIDASGASSGDPERLTSGLDATAFTIAPDGRQLLAVKQKSTSALWSFPAAADRISTTGEGAALTRGEFLDSRGRWLADGVGVMFQSNRRGSLDIWKVIAPNAEPVRITSSPAAEQRPRISPDGKWVAVDVIGAGHEGVHLMRPDGTELHTPDGSWRDKYAMTCCVDWSPVGSRFAMSANATSTGFVRIDPTTGMALETKIVDLPGASDQYHRWSPDGRLLVYEAVSNGSWNLWVVDAGGNHPRQLTSLPGNERQAAWRPGSPFIYFIDDRRAVWRVPVDSAGQPTAEPRPWMELRERFEIAADSLDFTRHGERLLVGISRRASAIWLVELGG